MKSRQPNKLYRGTNQYQDIQSIRVPIIGSLQFRGTDAAKDQRFVNGFFDVLENPATGTKTYFFQKRPGMAQYSQPTGGAATGRGVYYWNGNVYTVYGNKIYSNNTDLGVVMTTSTGLVSFAESHPNAATRYLAINDGIKLFCISTTNVVTTVTVNFPSPNTGSLIIFDRYWFVQKADGTIWNSDYDDPTTWTASKYIVSQMQNSVGVGLALQGNTLLAFGDHNTQAFYDAANVSGSPLTNYDQLMQQIGCASAQSIVQSEDTVTWVTNALIGGYAVYICKGANNFKDISTKEINQILTAEGTAINSCYAYAIRNYGKHLYVLTLTSSQRTFVYDYDTDLWVEWEGTSSGTIYPIVSTIQAANTLLGQDGINGKVYTISPIYKQDDGVNFTVLARTGRIDFDILDRKFMHEFELIGDKQTSTTNVGLRYSDDDYQSYSSSVFLDMGAYRAYRTNLGSFRRRAFEISYTGANDFRLQGFEVKISVGNY